MIKVITAWQFSDTLLWLAKNGKTSCSSCKQNECDTDDQRVENLVLRVAGAGVVVYIILGQPLHSMQEGLSESTVESDLMWLVNNMQDDKCRWYRDCC